MKQYNGNLAKQKWLKLWKGPLFRQGGLHDKRERFICFVLCAPLSDSWHDEPKDVRKTPQIVLIISHSLEHGFTA